MSVQRYRFYANNRDLRQLRPEADGDVVKFTDHQYSLAEREQRIAELRHHVEVLCGCVREGHAHEVTLARAALAATEGETK